MYYGKLYIWEESLIVKVYFLVCAGTHVYRELEEKSYIYEYCTMECPMAI